MKRPTPLSSLLCVGLWLLAFAMLQWSVVRFRVVIVLSLTAAAAGLGAWLWRRSTLRLHPGSAAAVLVGSAVVLVRVPMFSYVHGGARSLAVALLVVGALLAAALVMGPVRARPWAPLAVALAGLLAYAATSVTAVLADRAPRIDVWVTLQQSADGLLHGQNMYAMTWVDSPGIKDAFTYLPWTSVLLAPGRWLFGDVRWALLFWSVLAFAGLWRLGRGRWPAAYAIALVAVAPGTLTQVDQAWTEPLLLAAVVWWAVLVDRDRAWLAVIPLAFACASKQHLALLLPILLVWRPFGLRRTVATGAVAGVLIAPWFLWSPSDFVHDTITLLVGFHPIRFANTWYLLALNRFGITLPFWLTGLVVLGVLALAVVLVWRRQPSLAEVLRWLAFVLLVANLVNKQAFYNQFWFSAALVAASLAAGAPTSGIGAQGVADGQQWRVGARGRVRPALVVAPPDPADDGDTQGAS